MASRARTGYVIEYPRQFSSQPQTPTGEILKVSGSLNPDGDNFSYIYKDGTTRWVRLKYLYATRDEAVAACRKELEAAVRRAQNDLIRAESAIAAATERLAKLS